MDLTLQTILIYRLLNYCTSWYHRLNIILPIQHQILGLQRGSKSKAQGTAPTSTTSETVSSALPSTSNPTTDTSRCNTNTDLVSEFTDASNAPTNPNTNSPEQSFNDMNFEMPDDSEMDLINDDGQNWLEQNLLNLQSSTQTSNPWKVYFQIGKIRENRHSEIILKHFITLTDKVWIRRHLIDPLPKFKWVIPPAIQTSVNLSIFNKRFLS